jgi:predicted metal-binding membrane protein
MWPRVRDDRLLVAALAGLIGLTWLSLWTLGRSPYGHLAHDHGGATHGFWAVYLAVGGWTLMTVAMMLPTTLPLVALFRSVVRTRASRGRLTGMLIAGYLLVWTLLGLVALAARRLIDQALAQSAWLDGHAWLIGTAIVLLAGAYQFTPLKHACLEKCRSPLSFVMQHWHGEDTEQDAFRLGIHHGLFCIGCCWSLMLLMFVVGVGSLAWMLALAAVMTIEKNVSWGRRLSAPLGLVMMGAAAALVAAHTLAT